ncbi:hypothetical protein [Pelosinus sp. sgz500959]|uniref:hypothetical protein n=1 Tax=Pelosinus sp. sgz500959 TaxID=3242472 RepID=UPI00366F71B1
MPSINESRYRAKLEEVLASYSLSLVNDAKKLANEALKNIQSGMPVNQAIDKALNSTGFFVANNTATIDAIYMAACAGYGILPEIVANPGNIKAKLLKDSWAGDGMKLSDRLHGTSKQMRTDIVDTVSASMRKQDTCVEMARTLYDGYGADEVITKAELPKYLDNLRKAARGVAQGDVSSYKEFERTLKQVEQQLNKLARNGTPTLAQKDGYRLMVEASKALGNSTMDPKKIETLKRKLKKQGLDSVADLNQAIADVNNKALDKAARVAIEERTRYHAERIARTESARAWFDGFIAQNHDNPDIVAYKWVLSSRHKHLPFDICDVYANADFGLGKGVFPKDKAPSIPVHPHCMCSLLKVYNGDLPHAAKFDPSKASKYIDSLPDDKRKLLLGVGGNNVYDGDNWTMLARNHNGFGKCESRLSAKDFELQLFSDDTKEYLDKAVASGIISKKDLEAPKYTNKFKKTVQQFIDKDVQIHSLDNLQTRQWYIGKEKSIPDTIDTTLSIKEQAWQAFELRNAIRNRARDLMSDLEATAGLRVSDPNRTWEQIIARQLEKGFIGEEIWLSIISTSQKSRSSVNKSLGLE